MNGGKRGDDVGDYYVSNSQRREKGHGDSMYPLYRKFKSTEEPTCDALF